MKMDLDYLSKILNVFIESDKPHVSWEDVEEQGVDLGADDDKSISFQKFYFHLHLILDNELISNEFRKMSSLEDLGLDIYFGEGYSINHDLPLRLTQKGHDFAASLNNKLVLDKLKTELKDAPFKAVFDGGQKLLQHYFKKKIEEMIE